MSEEPKCDLCGHPATRSRTERHAEHVQCDICGEYEITTALLAGFANTPAPIRLGLSMRVRRATDAGEVLELNTTNYERLAADATASRSVPRMIRLALEQLAKLSHSGGASIPHDDFSAHRLLLRIAATSINELEFVLDALQSDGSIVRSGGRGPAATVTITAKGWLALEPVAGLGVPGTCFVAMWFHRSTDLAYDNGIRAAVEDDCGLQAVRIDRLEHVNLVDDEIISRIRSAQCMVADFTGQRRGVYFEAGFALALDRKVIWTCHKARMRGLHFDTSHYNFIDWIDEADLRTRLTRRLRALGLAKKMS